MDVEGETNLDDADLDFEVADILNNIVKDVEREKNVQMSDDQRLYEQLLDLGFEIGPVVGEF